MNLFRKSLILVSIFITQISLSFALPSVTPSIPDFSGQYVYYRDFSFERESYIGILYYDDSTYALRYYAPAVSDKKNSKPEKDIHILFLVNPENKNLELTGERILSSVTPADTDLVNYIHDFFYELTKRRQNAGDLSDSKSDYQDYEQFGGKVRLFFNPLIPIFNLERIDSVDKKTVLQIITAGQLVSTEDKTFASFKGIVDSFKDKTHRFAKNKKATPLKINFKATENSAQLNAELDSSWNAAAENFYTLGNIALFTINEISTPEENHFEILKRRLLLGSESIYPNWKNQLIQEKPNGILYTQISYHTESDSYTYDFKFLRKIDSKTAGLYTLTVFAGAYTANKKYFNSIIASFN